MKKLYSEYRKLYDCEIVHGPHGNYKDFSILVARTWLEENNFAKDNVENIRKLLERVSRIKDELLKITVLDGLLYDIYRTISEAVDEYYLYVNHIKESQKMYKKLYKYLNEHYSSWDQTQLQLIDELCYSLDIPYPRKTTWVYNIDEVTNIFDVEVFTEVLKNNDKSNIYNFFEELKICKISPGNDKSYIVANQCRPTFELLRRAQQNLKLLNGDKEFTDDESNSIYEHNTFEDLNADNTPDCNDKNKFSKAQPCETVNDVFKTRMDSYCDFDAMIFSTLMAEYYYEKGNIQLKPEDLSLWDEDGFEPLVKEKAIQMRRRIFEELKDTKYVLNKNELNQYKINSSLKGTRPA